MSLLEKIKVSQISNKLTQKILKNVKCDIYYEQLFLINPESSFHHSSPFRHLFIKTPKHKRIMYQSCKEVKLTLKYGYKV
jgi:hypothetical protein